MSQYAVKVAKKACKISVSKHPDGFLRWQTTYGKCDVRILGENNTLRFDDEEVDELFKIIRQALERGLLYGEVLARPELSYEAVAQEGLSGEF